MVFAFHCNARLMLHSTTSSSAKFMCSSRIGHSQLASSAMALLLSTIIMVVNLHLYCLEWPQGLLDVYLQIGPALQLLDLAVTIPLTFVCKCLHWSYACPHVHWACGSPWWAKTSVCFLIERPWEGSDPLGVRVHLQDMEAASYYLSTPVTLDHTPSESVQRQDTPTACFLTWLVADR